MSKKTLNHANLSALGQDRLADLLLEVSTGSADIKRRLRLELSHDLGPAELGRDVRKRLVSLRRSTSFVGWRKRKAFIKDLQTQVDMITDKIGPTDPTLAFDLLWQFLEIAPSVYERTDDSRGDIGDVFRGAILAFDDIAERALLDPTILASRVWNAVFDNGYGEFDGIIGLVSPALGDAGFAHLKKLVAAYADAPLDDVDDEHEAFHFLRELRSTNSNYRADQKAQRIKMVLQDIATAEGDTGAYIAQYSPADLTRPDIAAEVAHLMLAEGKSKEALALLEAADLEGRVFRQQDWDDAFIACLTTLNRLDDAQNHRWTRFCETLNTSYLRPYLKALPDFEDIEAEDRARAHALEFPEAMTALRFLLEWSDHSSAAALILKRIDELDGNRYEILTPATEALRDRHPLASVLLWRAMINYALHEGRATRYGHAADHLADCGLADAQITDYGDFPTHQSYLQALETRHERKTSFWSKVSPAS
ncbi:hypothetical protein C1J03_24550 (plasmid) [Sulfitobacter sp. SK012]|uniref:DUF6880 family protein n=1 Tax=Sulfitobacter sp. SK012 TaxID=1389005 RepID=UPI000E0B8A68|nr:DUF6880 family protein [Sulfitobacter sp. SK012]AXI49279.1 hypothetical protein C1J03_24550 [Sulfitobacter sp. SK012]